MLYNSNKSAGFTLIEMAIVTLLSGLFMVAAMRMYNLYQYQSKYSLTIDNIDMVRQALDEFLGINGRYPCPADPSLSTADPGYGEEMCRLDIADPCPAQPDIVCTTTLSRDADGINGNDPVMIGTLPINTILDSIESVPARARHIIDAQGMKLTYAVSELMTNQSYSVTNPVNNGLGAIDVRDENDKSIIEPERSAHYVIFSHGLNRKGAYSAEGTRNNDCIVPSMGTEPPAGFNPGTTGMPTDIENCDNNDAIFVKGLYSLADDDSYFDDIIYFGTSNMQSLWLQSAASPPGEIYLYNTNLSNIGIGTQDPAEKLSVEGSIRAGTSLIAENGYCDKDQDPNDPDDLCLQPAALAGSGMPQCPAGEVAVGIEQNHLVCKPLSFNMPALTFSCPAGEFVISFSNKGNYNCSAP